MELYTKRQGIRAPQEKTYAINRDTYCLLVKRCEKYQKYLVHLFYQDNHHEWTEKKYISFDKECFLLQLKSKIPNLYWNSYDNTIAMPNDTDDYDQYGLLDYIEFLAYHMQDMTEDWNNKTYKDFKYIEMHNTDKIFHKFKKEINEIFDDTGLLYRLTDKKAIERIVENDTLPENIEETFSSIQEQGVKDLLEDAMALYKTPRPKARQDALEKLWDAFERLKTYYSNDKNSSANQIIQNMTMGNNYYFEMINNEFRELTKIGNDIRIRHHEIVKQEIIDTPYYDYLFSRCAGLISLAIHYLK